MRSILRISTSYTVGCERTTRPNTGGYHRDKSPRLDVLETELGIMYGARREEADGNIYWRTTQMVFPSYAFFPGAEDGTGNLHMYTPIDDEHTMHWGLRWHPTTPIPGERKLVQYAEKYRVNGMGGMKPEQQGKFHADWWPEIGPENDFMQDREVQRNLNSPASPPCGCRMARCSGVWGRSWTAPRSTSAPPTPR